MKKLFFFILVISLSTSCDPFDKIENVYRVCIDNNNVHEKIVVFGADIYPDTNLPIKKPTDYEYSSEGTTSLCVYHNSEYINDPKFNRYKSGDTITIFVLKETDFFNLPWDSVRKNYLILKRYQATYGTTDYDYP
jgi:hypothetical protein